MTKTSSSLSGNAKILIIGLLLLLISIALAIVTFVFWPRPVDVQIRSFDSSGAVIAIKSENLVGYTVNSLKVNFEYETEPIGQLRKDNFVVRSRAETVITIPITGLSISKALIANCLDRNDLPVQIKVEVDLRIISWTGYRMRDTRIILVPCADLVKSVLPKGNRKLADRISNLIPNQLKLEDIQKRLSGIV